MSKDMLWPTMGKSAMKSVICWRMSARVGAVVRSVAWMPVRISISRGGGFLVWSRVENSSTIWPFFTFTAPNSMISAPMRGSRPVVSRSRTM